MLESVQINVVLFPIMHPRAEAQLVKEMCPVPCHMQLPLLHPAPYCTVPYSSVVWSGVLYTTLWYCSRVGSKKFLFPHTCEWGGCQNPGPGFGHCGSVLL